MKVSKLFPQGYCKGVYNAIKVAIETRNNYPNDNIYILGLIIHNKLIKEALDKMNIISLYSKDKTRQQLLDEINDGIIILTAHGTDLELIEKIKQKSLKYIDTTCTFVTSTYEIIKNELSNNHEVIYIGIHNHPEATATISINPNKIHLVENILDIKNLNINDQSPLITNQTTLSIVQIQKITDEIIKKFPHSRISNEQCSATRLRQNAIINIQDDFDLILIVGDTLSNNSKQLEKLAKNKCEAHLIESINDLEIEWLKNKKNIALTSGASTPKAITNQVYEWLTKFDYNDYNTYSKPKIDYNNILQEFKK